MPSKAQVAASKAAQWQRLAQGAALLETPPLEGARSLPLDRIDPNPQQSRQVFDREGLDELAQSIREHGVLEPILVRAVDDGRYQVVAGERRVRAARLANLDAIPALVRELSDEQAGYITAVENLQREDLDLEDEARWVQHLMELTGLSGRQLAEKLGKGHAYVNRRLTLLSRPDLLGRVRMGEITQVQALALARKPINDATVAVDHGDPMRSRDSTTPTDNMPAAAGIQDDDPAPRPVERAVLDQDDTPALAATLPYRARAWDSAITVLLRTNLATVPASERPAVRQRIAFLREALVGLEQELGDAE